MHSERSSRRTGWRGPPWPLGRDRPDPGPLSQRVRDPDDSYIVALAEAANWRLLAERTVDRLP